MSLCRSLLLAGGVLAASGLPAQTLVGQPCLFTEYFAEWRCFPAILRDAQGTLSCGGHRLNNGGLTQAPPAAGAVSATRFRFALAAGAPYQFAYRDRDGGIQDLWYQRRGERDHWFAQKLNDGGRTEAPRAAGDPCGFATRNTYHVVYRDLDGALVDLSFDGTWRQQTLKGPRAAGDPIQTAFAGIRHVLYRDAEGGIQDLWFESGWHGRTLNLGNLTDAPAAAGEPVAVEVAGAPRVTYRDAAGVLQDLALVDGAWQAQALNGGAVAAAPAAGDPAVLVLDGGVRHIAYRDAAGAIQQLWQQGGWQVRQLNLGGFTDAPGAVTDPVLLVPPSGWEYVGYVDAAGQGQLLVRGADKTWSCQRLDANTPPGKPEDN